MTTTEKVYLPAYRCAESAYWELPFTINTGLSSAANAWEVEKYRAIKATQRGEYHYGIYDPSTSKVTYKEGTLKC